MTHTSVPDDKGSIRNIRYTGEYDITHGRHRQQ